MLLANRCSLSSLLTFPMFPTLFVVQELPGNELPAIATMRRASATGAGVQQTVVNHAAHAASPSGQLSIHSSAAFSNQDALQPRSKKDKHAAFTSPPPHLLPHAATPMRGSPSPASLAAAGSSHHQSSTLSPSVLNQGPAHHSSDSKADSSGRSPGRGGMHAKIDVRM
jgi:hypothetical protein